MSLTDSYRIQIARKYDHVTQLLMDLHWLRVPQRIQCVLVHGCLNGAAPGYLSDLLFIDYVQRSSSSLYRRLRYRNCLNYITLHYIFFHKNHQSLIPLCITSSLESTSYLISSALHKTPCWRRHTLIHLPPTRHSHPPSHIHCSIPGSELTFSTNLFHHS